MADLEDLTAEQTEKLLQFQDLSGTEDLVQCREILEQHGWDIEIAVQSRFAEQEGRDNIYREPRVREEPRTPPVDTSPSNQRAFLYICTQDFTLTRAATSLLLRVFTVARARPNTWRQWGYLVVLFPFKFLYTTVFDVLRFAYRLLRPDPRRVVTDPHGDVRAFVQNFENSYGETRPPFFDGTYSQALNEAKRELMFLLVYLHGDDHQDTEKFCRETLCSQNLIDHINGRLLIWGCNTNSPEGYRVSQALRENTYPFLALIVLRQNKMSVVARIEGPITADNLIPRLTRLMADNEASLVAARVDRNERSFNQSLREEQDQAYQQSLEADREKARKKQAEEEIKAQEERKVIEQREAEERRIQERTDKKTRLRDSLPQEPDDDHPDVMRVLLKLPNGVRLERRFNKTHSLSELYNYVFVHEAAPDDFQIVTNFPRKVLPCEPTADNPHPPSFAEIGLGKNEMLFVHDNEA